MGRGVLALAWLLAVPVVFSADVPWHLATADMRFEMRISQRPQEAVAGVIAEVPDGGLLPKSKFRLEVVDPAGKPLKSETLWHNPTEGLALVFEPPEADTVFIYPVPAEEGLKFVSSFRPSVLLYVRNGNASLEQARALADNPPVGNDIYFAVVDRIFHSILPVGRDNNSSAYYSGWFYVLTPGKRYFYTISQDGSEFLIDGSLVHSWPGRHNRQGGQLAEHGNWVNLAAGLHQARYFHFSIEAADRESQLGWTPPEGRPKKDGRAMAAGDFVHSGRAGLVKASSRHGPLAAFTFARESIINLGEEISLFRFHGLGEDPPPAGTTYEWNFGEQRKIKGQEAVWLHTGQNNQQVTLTVFSGQHTSKCARIFFPKSPIPTQLLVTQAETRLLYSEAFLVMCRAAPAPQRPCESWNEAMWKGLVAVIESPLKAPLLTELFERSHPDIQKLPAPMRWTLEETFVNALSQTNPAAALVWLDRFEKEDSDANRIRYWESARIEMYLYEFNDLTKARAAAMKFLDIAAATEKARAAANQFLASAAATEKVYAMRDRFTTPTAAADKSRIAADQFMESSAVSTKARALTKQCRAAAAASNQSVLAIIRMGDVERLSGNMEEARRLYGLAQKIQQKLTPKKQEVASVAAPPRAPTAGVPAVITNKPSLLARPAQTNKPASSQKHKKLTASLPSTTPGRRPPGYPLIYENIQEWKVAAVHEAAYYATVQSLIQQQALDEARQSLDQWELEFPLSKLYGDYPLAQARYYMALGLYQRARSILAHYRESVDLTNYLPEAMKLEFECLTLLGQRDAALNLARLVIKRLPNHPLAEEAAAQLLPENKEQLTLGKENQPRALTLTASEQAKLGKLADLFGTDKTPTNAVPAESKTPPRASPLTPSEKARLDKLSDMFETSTTPAEAVPAGNETPE